MSNDLSRRLDRLTHQHEANARRRQGMAPKPPFDYAGFERELFAFWQGQVADLDPEQVDARLNEAAAAIRAATPQGRSGW